MSFWNYYVLAIIIIYLSAFLIRNLITYFAIKASIRGRSTKLTISLVLSTIIYLLTLFQILFPAIHLPVGGLSIFDSLFIKYLGFIFLLLALIIGLAALFEMKNSWRVGIVYEHKTDLVTTGIYALSRNPYFLSYDLLFLGILLIFPSFLLLFLVVSLAVVFHLMIVEEERYLARTQGESYLNYRKKVGRYFLL